MKDDSYTTNVLKMANLDKAIEKIVILSESSRRRRMKPITYMCVVHMHVKGRRVSFTRHVPISVMDELMKEQPKLNVINRSVSSHA